MTGFPEFFNFYQELSQEFTVENTPEYAVQPQLLLWNEDLQRKLDIPFDSEDKHIEKYLVGNQSLPNCPTLALAYSGHQFGHFNPLLGDGRAHYLGSFLTENSSANKHSFDLQLKGSGATNFSRGGDGFCALGPAVREFVMSKAIAALNVPTTHCLSVVVTGAQVYRQQHLPGAVVCRVASSHIRVGSFQYLALNNDVDGLHTLMELAIARHFPEITEQGDERILSFINAVCNGQIALIVEWLRVGFIHGVMNTDNCLVSGETIDYGPCAMIESFGFDTVFSSIDKQARYAFGNQPNMANWNCARLAESLITLMSCDEDIAIEKLSEILNTFSVTFDKAYHAMWAKKLGILQWQAKEDASLLTELFALMKKHKLDYTNTFAALTLSVSVALVANNSHTAFIVPTALSEWFALWQQRISEYKAEDVFTLMKANNPALIPRNHLVEEVIKEFYELGESPLWQQWQTLLATPYDYKEYDEKYTAMADDKPYQTFCGT